MSTQETLPAFPIFAGELPTQLIETAPSVPETSSRFSRIKSAIGGLILTSLAFTGAEAITVPEASAAPSCYGDYCSGQYAGDTGCDKDAKTLSVISMNSRGFTQEVTLGKEPSITFGNGGPEKEIARLEVRYSQSCGTAWAKLNTRKGTGINYVGIEAESGYTQKRRISGTINNGSPDGMSVSPMIYGRDHSYRAFVEGKQLAVIPYGDGGFWVGVE